MRFETKNKPLDNQAVLTLIRSLGLESKLDFDNSICVENNEVKYINFSVNLTNPEKVALISQFSNLEEK